MSESQPMLFRVPSAAPSLMYLRAKRDALLAQIVRCWPADTGLEADEAEGTLLRMGTQSVEWLKQSVEPGKGRLMDDVFDFGRLQAQIRSLEALELERARRAVRQ